MHQGYLLLLYVTLEATGFVVYVVLVDECGYALRLLEKIDAFKAVFEEFVVELIHFVPWPNFWWRVDEIYG